MELILWLNFSSLHAPAQNKMGGGRIHTAGNFAISYSSQVGRPRIRTPYLEVHCLQENVGASPSNS